MRPLLVDIRLDNLRENYLFLRRKHGRRLLAVLKANAYGHGAIACAQALKNIADGFAVACLEEALALREAGIVQPIVLLEGVFESQELELVEQYRLWPVIQSRYQLEMVLAAEFKHPLTVWLKMDSGMHRAGFFPGEYASAYEQLVSSDNITRVVKMTHFACSDVPESDRTVEQMQAFEQASNELPGEVSVANSAAILAHPNTHRDWGRGGLALYGISPMPGAIPELKPVMRLYTRIFGVRELSAGEFVGYGGTFVTSRPSRIGLIACGYADGYPRTVANGTPVLVDGLQASIAGRVSMDMITIDLTDIPGAGIGSEVELWGDHLDVRDVAQSAGTIAYELLCNVKRAHRRYL